MLTNGSRFKRLLLLGLLLGCAGCAAVPTAPVPPAPAPAPAPGPPVASRYPTDSIRTPPPRAEAALRLTEQARQLIAAHKADEAIRALEKALNLDPQNGRSYYFLSEAWLLKNDRARAAQFNRLAARHLERDPVWEAKVKEQNRRIQKSLAQKP